jgi:glycosyltransferase involved in cell wall biosynthesis
VIAARAGALPEVVGDAGLLVDPRDPAAIAAALTDLGRDALLARQLAEAGPARAAGFRWSETADQVTRSLRELA